MRSHSLNTAQALLDDASLEQLRLIALQYRARHRAAGRSAGIHASRQRGTGMDLHDSRPYQAGDDVRHMDWRATARSSKPVTKVFVADVRRDICLFIDRRPTMMFGTRRALKAATAAQIAALLSFQALAAQGSVSGLVLDDAAQHFPARTSFTGILPLLHAAAAPPPHHSRANQRAGQQRPSGAALLPPGIAPAGATLYLISDFHDIIKGSASIADYLPTARAPGTQVIAIRIVDDAEQRMTPAGVLRLASPESMATILVDTDDPALRQRYALHNAQRSVALATECALHDIALFTLTNCDDLHTQIEPLL
ncbi:MAG: DUF58 domain-containing protein [Chromatiales bacterium]|jgi:uncharacterized protein (DUF58 family)|nr:DUF58 domain-containing protein [Chromatiales bacterium]